jgi:hypothetical protein
VAFPSVRADTTLPSMPSAVSTSGTVAASSSLLMPSQVSNTAGDYHRRAGRADSCTDRLHTAKHEVASQGYLSTFGIPPEHLPHASLNLGATMGASTAGFETGGNLRSDR